MTTAKGPGETTSPLIFEQFCAAFSAITSIGKSQKNKHHGYAFRGIDDVLNTLHGVLAEHELFYLPRLDTEAYEAWETSTGKRMQVARLSYCFDFYAKDGSSLTIGPVIGQSADTDDKAPMQALSQAAKVALLHAFCIPTEDMGDGDATSRVEEQGGRVADAKPDPADPGKLKHIENLYAQLPDGTTDKTLAQMLAYAKVSDAQADATITKLEKALDQADGAPQ